MSIIVYIEQDQGIVKSSSLEAVSYAASLPESLGGKVTVLGVGTVQESEWEKVGAAGASRILHIADERLNSGVIQAHATAIALAYENAGAKVLVLAKSSLGDAVAARLSIKLAAGLVSNVVALPDLSEGFKVRRSIFTGKAFADSVIETEHKILAIKKNTIAIKTDGGQVPVEELTVDIDAHDFSAKIMGTEKAAGNILLPEADIVVSGGRGLKEIGRASCRERV